MGIGPISRLDQGIGLGRDHSGPDPTRPDPFVGLGLHKKLFQNLNHVDAKLN